MDIVLSLALSILGGVIVTYGYDKCPRIAQWLIRRSASRLHDHERWEQEWLSDLDYKDGKFDMLLHGLGCARAGLLMQPIDMEDVLAKAVAFPIVFRMNNVKAHTNHLGHLVSIAEKSRSKSDCDVAAQHADYIVTHLSRTQTIMRLYQGMMKSRAMESNISKIEDCIRALRNSTTTIRTWPTPKA